ncbi:MAG: flagellin [Deltaproteobacteria bacterium]|nr:flagellin [Deltaproteobacteria bacterium]MDZ4346177.1 flagellin [Candidatus Binatia bacterium]
MALIINTNISALTAQRNLTRAQGGLERSIQRLSTGLRINGAVDDAAGMAISDRLTAQIRGLNQAVRNANDGVSAFQTADGSLNEVSNLLQRARELAIQSANDSNSSSDRSSLNAEVSNILAELDRLASTVQFNNRKLLDGTFSNAQFQVGANAYETVTISISSVNTADLGAKTLQGAAVSSTALAGLTSSSTLTVNGLSVTIGAQDGIEGVINAINNESGNTKGTAIKNNQTVVVDSGFVALTTAGATQTLTMNSVTISLSTGNADANSTFIATVNGFTNQTGVVAATNSVGITFTRASGGTIALSETTASVGVGDVVASTASRTFNAGFTLSVDLDKSLTVVSSATGDALGFTTGVVNTTVTSKQINGLSISNVSGANDAISTIDFALSQLNRVRGDIGAVQNRFSSAISSLSVASENLSAARSRIQDADVALETAELTRSQILIQAGVAVLAQANQLPSVALSLLGGR